ncbi:MAG: heavy metal translocating P-type ATPase [Faecalimonas sp.]|nr:heavy metal translocating P-type ATPase [Faecalimonas sp.]
MSHTHHHHDESCECCHSHEHHAHHHHEHSEHSACSCGCGHDHIHSGAEDYKKIVVQLGIGAVFFVLGILLGNVSSVIAFIFQLAAYLILGGEVLLHAAKNIAKGHIFDENFLMSLATLAAFAIGESIEAVAVMLFFQVGELCEEIAVSRSRSQIMEAVDLRPEVVSLLKDGEVQVIPAEEAKLGEVLLVKPGERIPLDGTVVQGESRIDTAAVTGESVPVKVVEGDAVISGCMNVSGVLQIRVEQVLADSMVSRILRSVENAAESKPKMDRFITKFSKVYTPFVVVLALLTAVLPSLFTGKWEFWIYTAITFLVISCPCALVLSVPLAFFSGIGAGSKKGILFKGGLVLEALKNIRVLVLDKTGTITQGNFEVQEADREVLAIAASCEASSTHPIAVSIVEAAKKQKVAFERPELVEEISGKGIRASLSAGVALCGNRELMEQENVNLVEEKAKTVGTEVFVALNGMFLGSIVIRDTVKAESKDAIHKLKKSGLKTVMLTGDTQQAAEAVARETGIDTCYARLHPEDKFDKLKEIRETYGAAMFVGDGINDAPVLAGADVGAAMGSGADAAIEAADVVFMNSSLMAVPEAIAIAKTTNRIAMQNVVFALGVKALVMILGLCGFANMWMAVFADTGVAMLCVLNSVRVLYRK